jgi:hypothetical protein
MSASVLAAAPAFGAGELEFNSGTAPAAGLAPGASGTATLSLTNVGDAAIALPDIAITATLPADIVATSVSAPLGSFFLPPWTCSVGAGGATVTCAGNANFTLPAGATQCNFAGFQNGACNVTIEVQASPTAALGQQTTEVQACVTGDPPPCATASLVTSIQNFGDGFGLAPINVAPGATDQVPALPDASHAFWAGACDRATAPAPPAGAGDPPAPITGGVGGIPPRQLVPASYFDFIFGVFHQAPVLADSPAIPEHCIDPGVPSGYKTAATIWRPSPAPNGALGPQDSSCGSSFAPCWRLAPVTGAGTHPDGSTTMAMSRGPNLQTDGAPDNIVVDLPPGFVGNPSAVAECTGEQFNAKPLACPPEAQVGLLRLQIEGAGLGCEGGNWCNSDDKIVPVFNVEPRRGNVAELGFGHVGDQGLVTVRLVAKARTNGDFGVTAFAGQIPSALALISQTITLWGVPWAAENDLWRQKLDQFTNQPCRVQPVPAPMQDNPQIVPPSGLVPACRASWDPSWGPVRPFFTAQTECDGGNPRVTARLDSYQHPGSVTSDGDPDPADSDWKTYTSDSPPVTGCAKLPFDPSASFDPTSTAADGPSGLSADITIPQNNDPPASVTAANANAYWKSDAGLATSHLDKTVVPLPEGMSINPSAATGLVACTDAQMGVTAIGNPYRFNNVEPSCPEGSKIGTVEATTPLLDEKLTGEFILGQPKSTDPASGAMFRVFLVLRNAERGLLAKIHGTSTADPGTGQLTATFDKNPRVPVENIKVGLKGGERGLFAQAPRCGVKTTNAVFTPWTAAHGAGGVAKTVSDSFTVGGDCSFGFAPTLAAGMDTQKARGNGTFSFKFTRPQGDQWLLGLTAKLPKGLLASVRGLPLCKDAQAAAGACPAASQIGIADAKAGSGDPFVLERKGEVFLTEGYKGGEYGLMVKVRPIAGPFRGAMELSPIVVRQAIHVDRKTAQVTAVSDPFPTIHHGVPLRVREVTVLVNRGGFMLNPSDCSAKQVGATILSAEGARADVANHFQAAGCADLGFKPRLGLALKGRRQVRTGMHPAVRAVVRQQGVSEAGIAKAVVRLPKSLALDPDNAQALCEFEDGTKPDIENHCPKGSIVGRARARTPLLNDDLVGNVYFVKNVRIDEDTGNEIRTLPMIVVALRGEIAVNLVGESNTTRSGKLVNTFDEVPDAPITRFNLNIRGGKNGILAVTRTRRSRINLCARPNRHIAEADMDGQNAKRYDRNIRMKTPCRKKRPSAAKACRKRTNTKQGFKRCVTKVKRNRAQAKRRASAKRAAKLRADKARQGDAPYRAAS